MENNGFALKVKGLLRRAADVVYPARCPVCGEIISLGKYICEECSKDFCGGGCQTSVAGFPLYYVCEYDEISKPIVLGAKNDRDGDKLDFMAKSVYDMMNGFNLTDRIDGIVPIPMTAAARIKRGYSQTDKIAQKLSELSGIRTVRAVVKIRKTAQQKTLSREERQKNLVGAFALGKNINVRGMRLAVIDDVCTTGATLKTVSALLKSCGCESVICLCFAKAVSDRERVDTRIFDDLF